MCGILQEKILGFPVFMDWRHHHMTNFFTKAFAHAKFFNNKNKQSFRSFPKPFHITSISVYNKSLAYHLGYLYHYVTKGVNETFFYTNGI